MKGKIIIVEDSRPTLLDMEAYMDKLREAGYEIIVLTSFEEAFEYFLETLPVQQPELIRAIIFDYSLEDDETSLPLVRMAKEIKSIDAILLANSSDTYYNTVLCDAGCTHQRKTGTQKYQATETIFELLK